MSKVEQLQANIRNLKADAYDTLAELERLNMNFRNEEKKLTDKLSVINQAITGQANALTTEIAITTPMDETTNSESAKQLLQE